MRHLLAVFLLAGCVVPVIHADEFRPAYLEIRLTGAETYDLLWKVPAAGGDRVLALHVMLPAGASDVTEPRDAFVGAAHIERRRIHQPGGLEGRTIGIDGLTGSGAEVLARVERMDGTAQVIRLMPSSTTFVVTASTGRLEVARTYVVLGVQHILSGIDHLLYILALLFLVKGWRRIVATMSAFTATHSLTLTAAALGWVHVPQPPVEACIALSIVFVAREIVQARRGCPGLTARWPWVVSFTFGLMHGFGFAGALAQIGLPANSIPVALLCFNVGVEIGQLLFVAATLWLAWSARALLARWRPMQTWHPMLRWVPPYAIGAVASFWLIERVVAFWA